MISSQEWYTLNALFIVLLHMGQLSDLLRRRRPHCMQTHKWWQGCNTQSKSWIILELMTRLLMKFSAFGCNELCNRLGHGAEQTN
jgi:hypothetical protein